MRRLVLLALFYSTSSFAHPVTFEGGWGFMSRLGEQMREGLVIYSPKWWLGTGVLSEELFEKRSYHSLHVGVLLKRWNLEDAQGNIYVFGGPGYYRFDLLNDTREDGGFLRTGFQVDFETRRFYSALRHVERLDLDRNFERLDQTFEASIGFAPYIADFDELNSWVVFKARTFDRFHSWDWIPTLRFFYQNFLWEVGHSFDGHFQLNFMVRY